VGSLGLVGDRHLQVAHGQGWDEIGLSQLFSMGEANGFDQLRQALLPLAGMQQLHHLLGNLRGTCSVTCSVPDRHGQHLLQHQAHLGLVLALGALVQVVGKSILQFLQGAGQTA
jgi:hypothetical protein